MRNFLSLFANNESENSTLLTFFLGTAFGLIGLIGYPLTVPDAGFNLVFLGLLIAAASFITGLFTGFLFGMPKRNPNENSSYTLNNSLVEVSEWLTKIIVGLGLVNLVKVPGYLNSIGSFVKDSTGIAGKSVEVYTICLVIFFSVFGLYYGYNYMRLILSQRYKESDDNMLKELETAKIEVEKQKAIAESKEKLNRDLLSVVNQTDQPIETIRSEFVQEMVSTKSDESESELETRITNLVKAAEIKTKSGLLANKSDPQKGQWGGKSIKNNRQVNATVIDTGVGLFRIKITVSSTDPTNKPIPEGEVVLFALHNTFGDPPIRLAKVENGIVELSMISYGSFTVGVSIDNGNTELELDLAELPDVSEYFKSH